MTVDLAAACALVVRKAARTTACAMLALVLTLVVGSATLGQSSSGLGLDSGFDSGHDATSVTQVAVVPDSTLRRLHHLNERFACSRTGLAEGQIPLHAVVERGNEVRLTSFDVGWAVYNGKRPGTLLSVCAR